MRHWFTLCTCLLPSPSAQLPWKILQHLEPHTYVRPQGIAPWPIVRRMKYTVCKCVLFMSWPFQQACQSLPPSYLFNRKGFLFLFSVLILLLAATQAELKLCQVFWLVWCFPPVCSGFLIGHESTLVRSGLDGHLK